MNESRRRIVKNTLSSYGRFAVTAVVFLFLTPLIVGGIGTERYGLWTLVLSVVGFFGVLDLGFGTAVVKFVGDTRGRGDHAARNEFVSTTLAIYAVLGLLAALGITLLASRFTDLFGIGPDLAREAVVVLWLVGLRSVVFSLPLSTFRGALFGSERIHEVNVAQLFGILLYATTALIVLYLGGGLVALALASLAAMLVEHAVYIILCYRLLPNFRLSASAVRVERVREVAGYSVYALIGLLSSVILLRMDPAIVSAYLPLGAVAAYGIALKLCEHGLVLTKQFANVLTPYFARAEGAGDTEGPRAVFERASRLAVLPPAALFVSSAVLGGDALRVWLGQDFAAGAPVLVILVGATLVSAPQLVASGYLFMSGHQRFSALAAAIAIPINVGVSLLLVRSMGMVGVALGTLTATVVVDLLILIPYALRRVGLGGGRYAAGLLRSVVPMSAQVVVLLGTTTLVPAESLLAIAGLALLGCLVFAAAAWPTVLDDAERAYVRRAVVRVVPVRAAGLARRAG